MKVKLKQAAIFLSVCLLAAFFLHRGVDGEKISEGNERLKSLPYVAWGTIKEEDKGKQGVSIYIPDLSYQGVNLYINGKVHLINMEGHLLREWSFNTDDWMTAQLNKEGDLFFIIWDEMLGKLAGESNREWGVELRFHHYIDLAENGDVYSLTRDRMEIPYNKQTTPILNDFITIVSSEGVVKKEISVFDLLGELIPAERLKKVTEAVDRGEADGRLEHATIFDVFHTNAVKVINRHIDGLCKKGDVLISVRELNLIAIVDIDEERVRWSWGQDDLDAQHDPTLLDNGNILIFDNGKNLRSYSRVIELNPVLKKIEFEYKGNPPESFHSRYRGSCQKLPNDNILITESDRGRVFEITPHGEIVWEFYNPDIKDNNKRAGIYRMKRLDAGILENMGLRHL